MTSRAPEQLLVSICNVAGFPRPSCLLLLNIHVGDAEWVDVGTGDALLVSGTGICSDDEHIYHLSIVQAGFGTMLTVLDRSSLEVVYVQSLPEVSDAHSLLINDKELFVTSTGTDEIIAFEIRAHEVVRPRLVWSATGSGLDTHHINSLTLAGDELLCSAFGSKNGDSWATAKAGYIYSITRSRRVIEGLQQPHTLLWQRGQLYFCNSQRGTVNTAEGVVARLDGYSRGLAFGEDGTMYASSSIGRHSSQADGASALFGNPSDPGTLAGRCAVVQIPPGGPFSQEIDISPYGFEIYDLLTP